MMAPRTRLTLAAALAAGLAWGCGYKGPATRENIAKIAPGMTLQEVEKILGGPGTEISKAEFTKLANLPPEMKMPGPPGNPGGPPIEPDKDGDPKDKDGDPKKDGEGKAP